MTPPIGQTGAVLCFWLGTAILFYVAAAFRSARKTAGKARAARADLEALLARRREALIRLPGDFSGIAVVYRDVDSARDRRERDEAEAEVTRRVRELVTASPAGNGPPTREIADEERRIARAVDVYNDWAHAANDARRSFPGGVAGPAEHTPAFPTVD